MYTSCWYISLYWSISPLTLFDDYAIIFYQNTSQEPTISSGDVLFLFQPKILASIDYIRNVNKQHPDAEANKYISRAKVSNVKKSDIVSNTDKKV